MGRVDRGQRERPRRDRRRTGARHAPRAGRRDRRQGHQHDGRAGHRDRISAPRLLPDARSGARMAAGRRRDAHGGRLPEPRARLSGRTARGAAAFLPRGVRVGGPIELAGAGVPDRLVMRAAIWMLAGAAMIAAAPIALTPLVDRRRRDALRRVVPAVASILDAHGVDYWADFGTLLGIRREQDIILGDKDADVSVLASEKPKILELRDAFG